MTLKAVLAIPYTEMVNFVSGRPVSLQGEPIDRDAMKIDDIWVISITDADLPPIFTEDSERVLRLVFADIDPGNPDHEPSEDSQFMKQSQAVQVVDFLERAQRSEKNVLLLVNCKHGMCRSGAVIDFAANAYGLGFWETKRKNPQMVPNYWVRYLLFKEHFKRKLLPSA